MPLLRRKTVDQSSPALSRSPAGNTTPNLRTRSNTINGPLPTNEQSQRKEEKDYLNCGELGGCTFDPNNPSTSKSLKPTTLNQVLNDHAILTHFIQYMDYREALSLIRFWLDAKNFQVTACVGLNKFHFRTLSELGTQSSDCRLHEELPCEARANVEFQPTIADAQGESKMAEVEFKSNMVGFEGDSKMADNLGTLAYNGDVFGDSGEGCVPGRVSCVRSNSTGNSTLAGTTVADINDNVCHRRRVEQDAIKLFNRYIDKHASHQVAVLSDLRDDIYAKVFSANLRIDPECFAQAQHRVYLVMESQYFAGFLRSDHCIKYQIELYTTGRLTLEDVLSDETALSYFMEFLEQENCRKLLEFWATADNFRDSCLQDPEKRVQTQEDAMIIYEKFYSLQATSPLGFSDEARFAVEQRICGEGGPSGDCFEAQRRLVEHVLEKNYFLTFLSSPLFYKYLSELISTVQTSQEFVRHKRSGSDASSDTGVSISTPNTLLAMDASQPGMGSGKKSTLFGSQSSVDSRDSMSISADKFDPDALWRRPYSGLLLGKINSMGQFIPDWDPQPDRKKSGESAISKKVKNFFGREEEGRKEDLAMEAAVQIIEEVTKITLASDSDLNK